MTEDPAADERFRKLRHDIASPLAAILAEAQLLLLRDPPLDDESVAAIQGIENQCRRMRDLLQDA